MKKVSKMLLPVLLLFAVTIIGYGAGGFEENRTEAGEFSEDSPLVIEEDGVKVVYDGAEKSFLVTDQKGYIWKSVVDEELYGSDKLNENWLRNTKSIFLISYAEISKVNPTVKTGFSYDADVTATKDGNTIRLECDFKEAGISLAFIVSVENGELVARIPASEIKENKEYKLLSMEVFPYFGACTDTEAGYMVYPDGCGALKYHNSVNSSNIRNKSYSWDIYGSNLTSLDTLEDNESRKLQTAALPVFGIKKGEHAFIAFSEDGEEEGVINMYPSGANIELNRMSFSFRYRTTYNILMSNININGTNTAQNINGLMYNEEFIALDHDVHYIFLSDDEADYSGMAGQYRTKLLEDGTLEQSELIDRIGVSVNILMAASEQGFWKNTVAVTTTAKQAETIINAVNEIGFEGKSFYTLIGWSKGGYGVYPQTAKPDRKVASISALAALLDSNNLIALQSELFYADEENGGFDRQGDVIKLGNQNVITDSSQKLFLFNTENAEKRLNVFMKTHGSAKRINFSLQSIGKILFRDENKGCAMHRGEVRDAMELMLQEAKDVGALSVEGANLYTLKYADLIYELPSSSSEYFISDMDIPFCQMVLHGSVIYTGDYGNLSSDYDRQLMEWIEYGYTPAFELTFSNSDVLKDTNYSELYTSQYESNSGRIEKAYQLYQEVISKVAEAYIMKHTVLEHGFIKVDYSNGYTIWINYTEQAKTYGDVTVDACGYRITGE